MNDVEVTVRGNITSDVRQMEFEDGNVLTSFRLASNVRRWDSNQRENVTVHTTWYTVNCRRGLGANVMQSLQKGHPVVVHGRLKQQKWSKEERNGETTLIDADSIGHDLTFGTTLYTKVSRVERVTDNAELASQAITADLVLAEEDDERTGLLDAGFASSWDGTDEEAPTPALA